jgi:hypothetical protein
MTSKVIEGKILDFEMKHNDIVLILQLSNGSGYTIGLQEKNFPFH